ncbi:MAG: DNA methyltransferase [Candidatus Caldipriscus sp.]|jgi:DNA modification methylase
MDKNLIVFGDAQNMKEIGDESVHLVVTSPPYFNAPFDYPDMFESYEEFLSIIRNVSREIMRVLKWGRVAALVVDDTLIKGKKYPVVTF